MAVLVGKPKREGFDPANALYPSWPTEQIGAKTFLRRAKMAIYQTDDRATVPITFHGIAGGCARSRSMSGKGGHRVTAWEQEVFRDQKDQHWVVDPTLRSNRLDGWRMVQPCGRCGLSDVEAIIAERFAWQEKGVCFASCHPGFFASLQDKGGKAQREEAVALCATCPVYAQCADWGLRLEVTMYQGYVGILGGLTQKQRRAIIASQ